MQDVMPTCIQCDAPFVFSVTEQKRCAEHNFDAPSRCPECRKKKSKLYGNGTSWKKKGKRKEKRFSSRLKDDD